MGGWSPPRQLRAKGRNSLSIGCPCITGRTHAPSYSLRLGQARHANSPPMYILGKWEDTRVPRENPCRHDENCWETIFFFPHQCYNKRTLDETTLFEDLLRVSVNSRVFPPFPFFISLNYLSYCITLDLSTMLNASSDDKHFFCILNLDEKVLIFSIEYVVNLTSSVSYMTKKGGEGIWDTTTYVSIFLTCVSFTLLVGSSESKTEWK